MQLGNKIMQLRKQKGMTQEELAQRLDVSPQAVSKWENDLSCPDIQLLPRLAEVFGVSVDELLGVEKQKQTQYLPQEKRKNMDELLLKIIVDSHEGDKVRVNLPMPLVKVAIEVGIHSPSISGIEALKNIDLAQVLALVEKGLIGQLIEVESADGDTVKIVVE